MCETPLIDGEGSMALCYTLDTLLAHSGDKRFAASLSHETPRVQSAVARFIGSHFLPSYPKTQKVIHDAPKIDFPLNKAYQTS